MSTSTRTPEFFVVSGALAPDIRSYVQRDADQKLIQLIMAGEFAYVLTASQMGKSSLMTRTAQYLEKEQNCRTARIDLTGIGTTDVSIDQWYRSLLEALSRDLRLSIDSGAWWEEQHLAPVSRFTNFLGDVVLREIDQRVVVFIDEIGCTLKLDFSDDFFDAIRFVYNNRNKSNEFNRITFVLLGVASPDDLIKERTRSRFNIGEEVILRDFSPIEAAVLQNGLEEIYPNKSQEIFHYIYFWSQGHPYLTQKLCQEVVDAQKESWSKQDIKELIDRLFLSDKARSERNLQFVRDQILLHHQCNELLLLYQRVYNKGRVLNDRQSALQNQLKLSGIVKVKDGYLDVRNRIYRSVFNSDWITESILYSTEVKPKSDLGLGNLLDILNRFWNAVKSSATKLKKMAKQNQGYKALIAIGMVLLTGLFIFLINYSLSEISEPSPTEVPFATVTEEIAEQTITPIQPKFPLEEAATPIPDFRFGYIKSRQNCLMITKIIESVLENEFDISVETPEYETTDELFAELASNEEERGIDLTFCFLSPNDESYLEDFDYIEPISGDFSLDESYTRQIIANTKIIEKLKEFCIDNLLGKVEFEETDFETRDVKKWIEDNKYVIESWKQNGSSLCP